MAIQKDLQNMILLVKNKMINLCDMLLLTWKPTSAYICKHWSLERETCTKAENCKLAVLGERKRVAHDQKGSRTHLQRADQCSRGSREVLPGCAEGNGQGG